MRWGQRLGGGGGVGGGKAVASLLTEAPWSRRPPGASFHQQVQGGPLDLNRGGPLVLNRGGPLVLNRGAPWS